MFWLSQITTTPPEEESAASRAPTALSRSWPILIALLAMLSTMIPYFIGASQSDGRQFMWLGYNLDDSCVYLSWMRQAAEGSTHAYNLFTTEPQRGMALNPLFLVLGGFVGLTHLPLIGVYHGARILFGFLLLLLVWKFIRLTVAPLRAQMLAFLLVCFSSGLGWIPFWWSDNPIQTPVDKWQPEAITYLSLYLSPLFCCAMALQVAILIFLYLGICRNQMRYAVGAGLCGLLLGLIHSYDVVSLAAVWSVFLLALTILPSGRKRAAKIGLWLQAFVAGLLTAPTVLYIGLQLLSDPVFRARAEVKTLSPAPIWIFAGYGVPLILAVLGALLLMKRAVVAMRQYMESSSDGQQPPITQAELQSAAWTTRHSASLILIVWTVMNFLVCYIPTSIQRKLLQGTHFPIAILAGVGAVWLFNRYFPRAARWHRVGAAMLVTFLCSLTNLLFILRDISNYDNNRSQTQLQRTYLQPGELEALEWVKAHSGAADALQPLPWIARVGKRSIGTSDESLACFTPGLIHRKVYCGHWGETPDFSAKLKELRTLELINTLDPVRQDILKKMNVRYLVFSQKSQSDEFADSELPMFRGRIPLPPYLQLVHSNADADVYEVSPELRTGKF